MRSASSINTNLRQQSQVSSKIPLSIPNMPSLFAQIVDKAQSALSPTPHYHDLPVGGQTAATDGQPQDQGEAVARKSHTLENLTHQFRTIQQQYS